MTSFGTFQWVVMIVTTAMSTCADSANPYTGNAEAVSLLLERVLPGSSKQFDLTLDPNLCGSAGACFRLGDVVDVDVDSTVTTPVTTPTPTMNRIKVTGSTASELSAGVGHYLREFCNMTIGWERSGGSYFYTPTTWPKIGPAILIHRTSQWSFVENVCTSSYTLVWHSWSQWERFFDWAALWGINMLPALVGQEEVQYKVFKALGLDDVSIRGWFNGPALLTWSRGQNSHGNGVLGPLPRSWMQAQWSLQRDRILPRMRDLGIVGQLPAFQGNVPWSLKHLLPGSNMTQGAGEGNGTGWMDSRDPCFANVADKWMQQLLGDFGTVGHVYQMDGLFEGTSWGAVEPVSPIEHNKQQQQQQQQRHQRQEDGNPSVTTDHMSNLPACIWIKRNNAALAGCPTVGCLEFDTVLEAQKACEAESECNGITIEGSNGRPQLRSENIPNDHAPNNISYMITNNIQCRRFPVDQEYLGRGRAGYAGIARTDPDATWAWQGYAIGVAGWSRFYIPTPIGLSKLQGFIQAPPAGKFLIIDMSHNGDGQWREFAGTWNTPFIWTSIHTYGGTLSLKGNLSKANRIPFDAMSTPGLAGSGFTPEGFDQNPVYYELIQGAAWRSAPVDNLTQWVITRAHQRYGVKGGYSADVSAAWVLLQRSSYSEDLGVGDDTGVGQFPSNLTNSYKYSLTHWSTDLSQPSPGLCDTWHAWGHLIEAASDVVSGIGTFRYDVVNTGREILAQISTVLALKFGIALDATLLDTTTVNKTGTEYIELLNDLDTLVSTSSDFLLGPWLASARAWGLNASDCNGTILGDDTDCAHFYEWNARVQLTTWYPTKANASEVPPRDTDYARKHWSPLVRDYYGVRASNLLRQALTDAVAKKPLNKIAVAKERAELAYDWTTSQVKYPVKPALNYLQVSKAMQTKYSHVFVPTCGM